MKVVSLFSGGGLGDYGLELAGMEIVYQVEIDEYCQKILKLRWPHVKKHKDIRTLSVPELPKCDLVAGGFPCQDISVAGKGKGIKGERSGLWKEFYRIVCGVRPGYVLVENVSALRSRGLTTVLSDLGQVGYDAEWHCIPASAVGAPHQRDRIWIVGYSKHLRFNASKIKEGIDERSICNKKGEVKTSESERSGEQFSFMANSRLFPERATEIRSGSGGKDASQEEGIFTAEGDGLTDSGKDMADTNSQRLQIRKQKALGKKTGNKEFKRQGGSGWSWWTTEPNVGRVAHGVSKRVDRLKLLGNGQVVQVVEWIGKRIMALNEKK